MSLPRRNVGLVRRARRDQWLRSDPLPAGELGQEIGGDSVITKVGDGVTPWAQLPSARDSVVPAGSLNESAFAPNTLIPGSMVGIPVSGADGTPTMRALNNAPGGAASGVDPQGLQQAVTWPMTCPFAVPSMGTLTANIVYCTRFVGGSPATRLLVLTNTPSGLVRAQVATSKNVGGAATPDLVKLDTGSISNATAGDEYLPFTAGGVVNDGDWLLFAADTGGPNNKFFYSFINSTSALWGGLSGYFTAASLAAMPAVGAAVPALTSAFGLALWAKALP